MTQPKRDDAEEIRNYRVALSFAAKALVERPLTPHLLRQVHAALMDGVRGRDKDPGSFRNEQNWVGQPGCPIEQASFVPIPQAHLMAGLDLWAEYVASRTEPDPLVQLAVVHAEFEALHPFKDGNGRLGRMIIPLFLYERKILSGPNFYMSGYLEERREQSSGVSGQFRATGPGRIGALSSLRGSLSRRSRTKPKRRRSSAFISGCSDEWRK